jgi:hypothetical protein
MTTLHAPRHTVLDESTRAFVANFMSHVASITAGSSHASETIAHIETLLLSAITLGDGASSTTWSILHRAIAELVATARDAAGARKAHAYLRSFISENRDLGDE